MCILFEPTVANPGEAEHPLEDEERMLDSGPDLRFGPVLCPFSLVDDAVLPVAAIGEIPRQRRVLDDHVTLATIGLVAPHPGLLAVQKIRQKTTVGDIGRRRSRRMDDLCLAVDADMRLHAKIPPVSYTHLRAHETDS